MVYPTHSDTTHFVIIYTTHSDTTYFVHFTPRTVTPHTLLHFNINALTFVSAHKCFRASSSRDSPKALIAHRFRRKSSSLLVPYV